MRYRLPMVYLDNNATTPPTPEVVTAMLETLETDWGNPSSMHRVGQTARRRVELARCGHMMMSERPDDVRDALARSMSDTLRHR